MAGIPGLEVTELPLETPDTSRLNKGLRAPPGPGLTERINGLARTINDASVGQQASRQAVVDGVRRVGSNVSALGSAVGDVAKAAYRNPLVQGVGTVGALVDIPDQYAKTKAALAAGDGADALDHGLRGVGSAVSLLPGAGGALGAAYRGGNVVGDAIYGGLNSFEGGRGVLDTIGQNVNRVARAFGGGVDDTTLRQSRGELPASTSSAVPRGQTAAAQVPTPAAAPIIPTIQNIQPPQSSGLNPTDSRNPQPAPGQLYVRTGNSFSDGSPSGSKSGFGVSTIGNDMGAIQRGLDSDRELRLMKQGLQDRGDPNFYINGGVGGVGSLGGSSGALGFNSGGGRSASDLLLAGKISPGRASAAAALEHSGNELPIANNRNATEMANVGLRSNTDLAINRNNNQVQREGLGVQERGQDMTLRGHKMANAVARAQMERQQFNEDRSYAAGRSDHADAQKTTREQALQRNIEATTVNPDGTPNPAAAAEYRRGIDRSVARLGAEGVHQLSPLDEQRLMAGSDLLKTMKANANWLPWNPDKLNTVDPVDLTNMRVLPNGDRQITRPGKAAGQTIPKRFFDTEEGSRFYGGTPTNKYDILHEGN